MSANLDPVRSIYADWERGDFSSIAWADPSIEYVVADGPSPGIRKGVAEMAREWLEFMNAWEGMRVNANDCREIDDERVLVFTGVTGPARTSGVALEDVRPKGASLLHLRDGTVTRLVTYWHRDRALADLGLEE
jgi:hypothetical protein